MTKISSEFCILRAKLSKLEDTFQMILVLSDLSLQNAGLRNKACEFGARSFFIWPKFLGSWKLSLKMS